MLCVGATKSSPSDHPDPPPDLFRSEAGNLYVADFGNFCVVRFSLDDAAAKGGAVVVGVRGKQLMDIDYLKASAGRAASCDLKGDKSKEVVKRCSCLK